MSAETVTLEQQEALIEFLERHKELALGRFSRTKEGRSLSKRLWVECAALLNSVSANCPTRGAEAWRTYYADYKSKLLKKIKRNKQELSATGGGQYSQLTLTALQERLYNILGRDVGEPLTGVRHNPLDVTYENEGDGGEEINIIEVPWNAETPATISTSFSLGHNGPMATTSSAAWDVPILEAMDTSTSTVATTTATMATTTATMATTTAAMATITAAMATTTAAATATITAATVTTTAATATTEPRRTEPRRRRRSRSRRRYPHREHEPEMTPLESAEQRLAAMESRSADATFALAQAINRLAEAVEDHGRRPIQVVIVGDHEDQSRLHRRRITSSSESE